MLTENCVESSSLRKRGPILTLCDPKRIPACAGMTKSAVALAQAGTRLDSVRSQMDSRLRGNDEVSRRPGAGGGPVLTLCDPKWIHACAEMRSQPSPRRRPGPNWRFDGRFPHEWPSSYRIGRILDPGLRRDDDDIRWTLWLNGDDLAVFHHIDRCAVLACSLPRSTRGAAERATDRSRKVTRLDLRLGWLRFHGLCSSNRATAPKLSYTHQASASER
jgi:hypothetical protein